MAFQVVEIASSFIPWQVADNSTLIASFRPNTTRYHIMAFRQKEWQNRKLYLLVHNDSIVTALLVSPFRFNESPCELSRSLCCHSRQSPQNPAKPQHRRLDDKFNKESFSVDTTYLLKSTASSILSIASIWPSSLEGGNYLHRDLSRNHGSTDPLRERSGANHEVDGLH